MTNQLQVQLYNDGIPEEDIAGSCPTCEAYYTHTQVDEILEIKARKDPLLIGLQCKICMRYFSPKKT